MRSYTLACLKIAADLHQAPALAEELKDFRRHVSDAGRNTYGARVGAHDENLTHQVQIYKRDQAEADRLAQAAGHKDALSARVKNAR